jgi:opacity protein-like surface antigen
MKNLSVLGLCIAILCAVGLHVPAHAADVYSRYDTPVSQPGTKLSGAYVQGGLGMSFAATNAEEAIGLASKGYNFDIRLGRDWRMKNSPFVFGLFTGAGVSELSTSGVFDVSQSWHLDVGGRAGYLPNSGTLIYALLAWQTADYEYSAGELGRVNETLDGVKWGGGVEFAIERNYTFGVEVTRTDFASFEKEGAKFAETDYNGSVRLGVRF